MVVGIGFRRGTSGLTQRLQTEYFDLYQCHRYDVETPLERTMEALTEIVRQGTDRHIGISERASPARAFVGYGVAVWRFGERYFIRYR